MFGAEMRRWRVGHNLSLRALATHVCYSYSYLAKIESGDRPPPLELANSLDEHFNTGGVFQQLYNLTTSGALRRIASSPSETGDYFIVPASRRQLIKGILGTSALAALSAGRAIAPTTGHADAKPVEVFRLAHKALIDEDNIYGPGAILPRVHRQVAQIESVLQSSSGVDAQELRFLQARFFELGGWLYQDLGEHLAAQDWLNVALSRAHLADSAELTCFILARQSQLAGDTGDGGVAIAAGQAASRHAPDARLAAIATTYEAHGHALARDENACKRSYDRASELVDHAAAIESTWGAWLDHSYVAVHSAHSMCRLGEYSLAIEEYDRALAGLGPAFRRDRGVYLARKALAHAGARDANSASDAGLAALEIATETRSGRILDHLTTLDSLLDGQRGESVHDFRDALRQTISGKE